MQFHFYDPLQGSTAARGQLAESLGSDSGDMSVTDLGKTIYRVLSRVSRDYNVLSNDHEVVVRAKGQDLPRLVITDSGRNDGKVKLALEVMGRNPQVWTMDKRSPLKIVKEIRMAMDHLLKEDSPPYPPHLKGSRAARGEQRELEYERKLEAEGKKRRRSNRASTKGARVRRSEIHEGASPKKKQTRKDLGLVDDVQRAMKMAQRALIADKRGLYWKSLVSAKDTIQKALDTFNDGDTRTWRRAGPTSPATTYASSSEAPARSWTWSWSCSTGTTRSTAPSSGSPAAQPSRSSTVATRAGFVLRFGAMTAPPRQPECSPIP